MTLDINRRGVMALAGLGLGALILPAGRSAAQTLAAMQGFTHNVASGEPGPDSALLWTRYVPAKGDAVKVRVEVSETADFAKITGGGQMITGPWRDHTVKITVDGLAPGKHYFFRFIAPDGSMSPIGRTKTLPVGNVSKFNIAIFSCSNFGFGMFNAYGHAAARKDIDLVLHMGDYIYEYPRGGYDLKGSDRAAQLQPATEIFSLADYRMRYACYRTDPDLQAMHQNYPVIPNTDDHEGANDGWEGGAQNHQANEGDWSIRRNAAMQVWREWMPVGETPWKSYDIGTLGSYLRTDSRMAARSKPADFREILANGLSEKALTDFRDGAWMDNAATMFGTEQESWIAHRLRASVKSGQKWQVVGSGTVMGKARIPADALGWLAPDADPRAVLYTKVGVAAGKAGLPNNLDNWGGYPMARTRFLKAAQSAAANLIVVSGDSHNAWANDLIEDKRSIGVEFGGHSVSSPGYESAIKIDPKRVAKELVSASPELKWTDTSNRGYMVLSLTPAKAINEYVFMDTVATRSLATKPSQRISVKAGRNQLDPVA
jgi:alkaline phosphatase D